MTLRPGHVYLATPDLHLVVAGADVKPAVDDDERDAG
jgi:chemotaxis response regulator CheB